MHSAMLLPIYSDDIQNIATARLPEHPNTDGMVPSSNRVKAGYGNTSVSGGTNVELSISVAWKFVRGWRI